MPFRLEVLQHHDATNRSVVHRLPADGATDIRLGAQLIVQQNQEAVFFRDGEALDRFGPGRHTLSTANVPLVTRLLTIPWQESPFQAQVCFIGKQLFTDQKWGTPQPITFRDREFGMIRLRGYGCYSFRVADSTLMINTLAGTQGRYTTRDVADFLRDVIVARLADLLGSTDISLLDMATHYDEIAAGARARVADDFRRYGLELVDFFINAISAPEEVQRAIDARSAIGAIGDLATYMKFQAVRSMRELAARGASGGVGFGVVMPGLIHQIAEGLAPPENSPEQPAKPLPAEPLTFDDLAATPTTVDPRAMVRAVADAAGFVVQELDEPEPNGDDPLGDLEADGFDSAADTKLPETKLPENKSPETNLPETQLHQPPGGRPLVITVPITGLRQQRVVVSFDTADEHGNRIVSFSSVCGPARPDQAMTLLEYNARMVLGAFAVRDLGSGPMVVLQANQLAETADPLEISRLLTAVAWQADRAEEKLTGLDEY